MFVGSAEREPEERDSARLDPGLSGDRVQLRIHRRSRSPEEHCVRCSSGSVRSVRHDAMALAVHGTSWRGQRVGDDLGHGKGRLLIEQRQRGRPALLSRPF